MNNAKYFLVFLLFSCEGTRINQINLATIDEYTLRIWEIKQEVTYISLFSRNQDSNQYNALEVEFYYDINKGELYVTQNVPISTGAFYMMNIRLNAANNYELTYKLLDSKVEFIPPDDF